VRVAEACDFVAVDDEDGVAVAVGDEVDVAVCDCDGVVVAVGVGDCVGGGGGAGTDGATQLRAELLKVAPSAQERLVTAALHAPGKGEKGDVSRTKPGAHSSGRSSGTHLPASALNALPVAQPSAASTGTQAPVDALVAKPWAHCSGVSSEALSGEACRKRARSVLPPAGPLASTGAGGGSPAAAAAAAAAAARIAVSATAAAAGPREGARGGAVAVVRRRPERGALAAGLGRIGCESSAPGPHSDASCTAAAESENGP